MNEGPNKRVKPASSSDSNSDSDFSPTPKRNKLRQDGQTIKKMPMNGEEKFMFFAPFQNGAPAAVVAVNAPVQYVNRTKKFEIVDLYNPSAEEVLTDAETEEEIGPTPPSSPSRKQ